MLLIESYMQGSRHFSMSMSSFALFVDQLIWLIFICTFKPCLVLLIFLLAETGSPFDYHCMHYI